MNKDLVDIDIDFKETFHKENFLFGVANAPYLIEGGFNYPDGIKNNYAQLELDNKIERSEEAAHFWTTYEEHIKLASSLGLNAFRMGFAWSRIQPTTSLKPHDPPPWDYDAVDHYAEIVETLIKYKMEPIITLHHFCHPAWLPIDMWVGKKGPNLLVEYAINIVDEINQRLLKNTNRVLKHLIVSNEANQVPPMFHFLKQFTNRKQGPRYVIKAADNLFSSYVKIYDGLYDLYNQKGWDDPNIGFGIADHCPYELDRLYYDLMRVRTFNIEQSEVDEKLMKYKETWNKRIGKLAQKKLTKNQYEAYLNYLKFMDQLFKPSSLKKTLNEIYNSPRDKKLDYISINVYEPFMVAKVDPLEGQPSWWEFAADSDIYGTFIRAHNDYNKDLSIYMGEHTLAYKQPKGGKAEPRPDGWTRERYLKTYLSELIKCIAEGIPVKEFLYWGLTDDYEWDSYDPRLGLYNYDYINHEIKETDALGEHAGEIYAELIATLRKGNKEEISKKFNID
jgi:6-phospho-beta-galactosidase